MGRTQQSIARGRFQRRPIQTKVTPPAFPSPISFQASCRRSRGSSHLRREAAAVRPRPFARSYQQSCWRRHLSDSDDRQDRPQSLALAPSCRGLFLFVRSRLLHRLACGRIARERFAGCALCPIASDIEEPLAEFCIGDELCAAGAFPGVFQAFYLGGHENLLRGVIVGQRLRRAEVS
jgi:hypothetical protein